MDAYFDSETRSTLNLKTVGVHRYARCADTDMLCANFFLAGQDRIQLWRKGEPMPQALRVAIENGARVYMHNAEFDTEMWNEVMVKRHGWAPLPVRQTRCTAVMASAMGLPRSLDGAAHAMRLPYEKDKEGQRIMLKLCRPAGYDDDLRPVWHSDPDDYSKLYSYGGQDIRVMWHLRRRMLDIRPEEQLAYELTTRINQRGVRLDMGPVRNAYAMVLQATRELNRKVTSLTEGKATSAGQRAKLIDFCADHMVGVPNLRRKTIELLLAGQGETMPDVVREVLGVRLDAAKASTAKLRAMIGRVCDDGRLRGSLLFYGAGTGRYSSVGVQLHNMPRPRAEMSLDLCWHAVELIRQGDRDMLDFMYGPTLHAVADALRSFIIPDPGKAFAIIDLAKIEAVINAWCAGQWDLLEAFKTGRDTYAEMASKVYRRPINRKVDKIEGQVGKVLILGAGYGLGGPAFWVQCILSGILISRATAIEAIATYRQENDAIVKHWYDQERAAMDAIRRPGTRVPCGKVEWLVRAGWLFCRLPSGRALAYPNAVVRERPFGDTTKPTIFYQAINPVTHQWGEVYTYGAALVENIVQAIAYDILSDIMVRSEDEGVPNVLSVHDEIVAESDHADRDFRVLRDLAHAPPPWAHDLPVKAEGGVVERYGKL